MSPGSSPSAPRKLRLLVTGAGGLVGGRLARILSERHALTAGWHVSPPPAGLGAAPLDLLSGPSLERALGLAKPEALLHAAALADAGRCEREPALAEELNARAPATLARACARRGIRLVALSTDLVLGGDRAFSPEEAPPRPLMVYGRTKLLGEEAVLAEAPGAAVVRIALVSGRGHGPRGSATESLAWALKAGRALRLFTDEYRTPVDLDSVALALERLLLGAGAGRYHLGGPERLSRFDLGWRVARRLGLSTELLVPTSLAAHPTGVPRPRDVSLDSSRARSELGFEPRGVEEAILAGRAAAESGGNS